jgi:hypothetical protein
MRDMAVTYVIYNTDPENSGYIRFINDRTLAFTNDITKAHLFELQAAVIERQRLLSVVNTLVILPEASPLPTAPITNPILS